MTLKPCPFCGGEPEVREIKTRLPNGKNNRSFVVACSIRECGVITIPWYPEEAARVAWNRRDQSYAKRLPDRAESFLGLEFS